MSLGDLLFAIGRSWPYRRWPHDREDHLATLASRRRVMARVAWSGRKGAAHAAPPCVALLTDFGDDYYVGVVKGVILSRAPEARIVDLAHRIAPGAVAEAAYVLASAAPYFPAKTVFCCVVDPGVGGARRRLAVRNAAGQTFVAPDNGLLTPVLRCDPPSRVRVLRRAAWRLGDESATFQGRSDFAPAAAAFALGAKLEAAGPPCADPVLLPPERRDVADGVATGEVVYVDSFGNLVTSLLAADVDAVGSRRTAVVRIGGVEIDAVVRTYSEGAPAAPLAYVGSSGRLEIAVRDGSAAKILGFGVGATVVVRRG